MNVISWTELRKLPGEDRDKLLPFTVTIDGEPMYILEAIGNVIPLTDLHPAVRKQLRAQEGKARLGMPPTVTITSSLVAEMAKEREEEAADGMLDGVPNG